MNIAIILYRYVCRFYRTAAHASPTRNPHNVPLPSAAPVQCSTGQAVNGHSPSHLAPPLSLMIANANSSRLYETCGTWRCMEPTALPYSTPPHRPHTREIRSWRIVQNKNLLIIHAWRRRAYMLGSRCAGVSGRLVYQNSYLLIILVDITQS